MRVIPNGSNQTIIEKAGCRVLYSYNTPVALQAPSGKYYKTELKWSSTTLKHINRFVPDNVTLVPQSVMDTWDTGAHAAFASNSLEVSELMVDDPTSWGDC